MKEALVYCKNVFAGKLILSGEGVFTFRYDDIYFADSNRPAISMTFPKTRKEYKSTTLFPFFFNLLSEGANKRLQCRQLRIGENDHFSLLLATAGTDTIGAVTVKPVKP